MQDQGQYGPAEEAFLRAGKPREAIDMFLHQHLWDEALRIAEAHDASAVPAIFLKQAEVLAQEDRLHEAEATFLLVCCACRYSRVALLILVPPGFSNQQILLHFNLCNTVHVLSSYGCLASCFTACVRKEYHCFCCCY
jgi:hypothetical protein